MKKYTVKRGGAINTVKNMEKKPGLFARLTKRWRDRKNRNKIAPEKSNENKSNKKTIIEIKNRINELELKPTNRFFTPRNKNLQINNLQKMEKSLTNYIKLKSLNKREQSPTQSIREEQSLDALNKAIASVSKKASSMIVKMKLSKQNVNEDEINEEFAKLGESSETEDKKELEELEKWLSSKGGKRRRREQKTRRRYII